jgi:hypothetical protein
MSTTPQNGYGDAQQCDIEQIEQRTSDGIGVPPANGRSDEEVATVVDVRC